MFQDKLKQFLSSVGQGASNFGKSLVNPATSPTANMGVGQQLNYNIWHSPFGNALMGAQKFLESPTPVSIPNIQANSTVGKAAAFVPNLGIDLVNTVVGQGVINPSIDVGRLAGRAISGQGIPSYDTLKSAPSRLGYNLMGMNNTPKQVVGNIAGTVVPPLAVWGGESGANLLKDAAGSTLKQGVLDALKTGVIKGAKVGGANALAMGLSDNRNTQDNTQYLKNVGINTGAGVAFGGLLGGILEGSGVAAHQASETVAKVFKRINPQASDAEAANVASKFLRDELGRFTGKGKLKNEPGFYGDLREQLGLPRNGIELGVNRRGSVDLGYEFGKTPVANDLQNRIQALEQLRVMNPGDEKIARALERLKQQFVTGDPLSGTGVAGVEANNPISSTNPASTELPGQPPVQTPPVEPNAKPSLAESLTPQSIKQKFLEVKNNPFLDKLAKLKDQLGTSSREILNKMGNAGKDASARIDTANNNAERFAGGAVADFNAATKGLSPKSVENTLRFLDGQQVALNETEAAAAAKIKPILDQVATSAQGSNLQIRTPLGEKVPFHPIENYIPHTIDLTKLKANQELTAQHLFQTGQFPDLQAATAFASDVSKGTPVYEAYQRHFPMKTPVRFGNLEMARILDWPKEVLRYDKNVIPQYLSGAYQRISQAQQFGPDNEMLNEMLTNIAKEGGDPHVAENILNRNLGLEQTNRALAEGVGAIKQLQATTKLGLSAISNAGQSVNTATALGVRPTIEGFAQALKPEGREFALRTGAVLDSTLQELRNEQMGKGPMEKLTAPGFGTVEKFNRTVAANAGKQFAQDRFAALIKNPADKRAIADLSKIGVDAQAALQKGALSEEDLLRAGQGAVNLTQFKTRPIDLPPSWSDTWGKLLSQFKSFAFKQGEFLKNEVINPARQGNVAPLSKYLILSLVVGEGIGDLKALVRNRTRPTNLGERLADNVASAGGFGVVQDAINAAQRGQDAMLQFIAGPTLTDIGKVGGALGLATQGKPKELNKFLLRNIPVVGQPLANTVYPPNQAYKSRTPDTLTGTLLPLLGPAAGLNAILPPGLFGQTQTPAAETPSKPGQFKQMTPIEKEKLKGQLKDLKAERQTIIDKSTLPIIGMSEDQKNQQLAQLDQKIQDLNDTIKGKTDYSQVPRTGIKEIDSVIVSKQITDLEAKKKDIVDAFAKGQITLDKANAQIMEIKAQEQALKATTASAKKPKGVRFTTPKISTSSHKTTTLKQPRIKGFKVNLVKYSKPTPFKYQGKSFKLKKVSL